MLNLFIETQWAHKGSANEMLSFTIGECFSCEPNLVIDQLNRITNQDKLELLFHRIEWGLLNIYWTKGNEEPTNPEYLNLKKKLDSIRAKK